MDELLRTTIGEKGRVVIPAQFREALGMKVGDTIFIEIVDGDLRISSFENSLKRTQEYLQQFVTPGKLMSDELIEDRRREVQKEEEAFLAWQQEHEARLQSKP